MRSISFYFQVHQPYRMKKYRFFNMGNDHHYYDEYLNRSIMERVAQKNYLPMNQLLLDLIEKHGKDFKVSFSITGMAIEQFEEYAPEVLESFKRLAATGNVEFLAETYSHSLVSLKNAEEFKSQVNKHKTKIKELFGVEPVTYRNTELIYSDDIGAAVADMGFEAMLTEGAKHVLGWKSPNYVYQHPQKAKLKLLLKNFRLSDDIAFRFSTQSWDEWPLTTDKYLEWLKQTNPEEEVINLYMDYETFGEHQWAETGIFDFMRVLPSKIIEDGEFSFKTPAEVAAQAKPIADLHVPNPISWADEERDLSAWLGNEMQDEAFDKLYAMADRMQNCQDAEMQADWLKLQTSDHFYYMCTKWFADGDVHEYFNPYPSPYEAFINYMNVLSDFQIRLNDMGEGAAKKEDTEEGFDFSKIETMTVANLKKFLTQVEVGDLAALKPKMTKELNTQIDKYLGKRKQKALDQYQEMKTETNELIDKAWKNIQKIIK
jgi:alpha-amylase